MNVSVETAVDRPGDGPFRLFDAHNHLHDERFGGGQAGLVAACREAGVAAMVVNGSCEADWPAVAALAEAYPDLVIPAFGLHPWYLSERSADWRSRLLDFLDRFPGAGVGEIGLDRWILEAPASARGALSEESVKRKAPSLEEQVEVFVAQLEIAAARNRPASLHCLQAWGPMFERLRAGPRPERGFLLHSYGGPAEMVGPLARLGAYFSFPGYYLHERKARQREVFRGIPADRLLIETDAPDQRLPGPDELARVVAGGGGSTGADRWRVGDLRGADGRPLNHPANLGVVWRGLAAVLGERPEGLAGRLEANFLRLFGPR